MCMTAAPATISGNACPIWWPMWKTHLHLNGPWKYKLSELYYEPAVTAAVEKIAAEEQTKVAA